MVRCTANYPSKDFRKWLTLGTFLTQYIFPLLIIMVAYICVCRRIWSRSVVGAATQVQLLQHVKAKKKTVKMLLYVVLLFAVCWLPLNTYHLVADFRLDVGPHRHSSSIFFICHWFAMSSVCYNPFIYSWLNDSFKAGAKEWLSYVSRKLCCLKRQLDMDTDYEQNLLQFCKARDSTTGSSSTTYGNQSCTFRYGIRTDSLRSKQSTSCSNAQNTTISEIHVPLNDVIEGRFEKTLPHKIGKKGFKKKLSFRSSSTSVSSSSSGYKAYYSPMLKREHKCTNETTELNREPTQDDDNRSDGYDDVNNLNYKRHHIFLIEHYTIDENTATKFSDIGSTYNNIIKNEKLFQKRFKYRKHIPRENNAEKDKHSKLLESSLMASLNPTDKCCTCLLINKTDSQHLDINEKENILTLNRSKTSSNRNLHCIGKNENSKMINDVISEIVQSKEIDKLMFTSHKNFKQRKRKSLSLPSLNTKIRKNKLPRIKSRCHEKTMKISRSFDELSLRSTNITRESSSSFYTNPNTKTKQTQKQSFTSVPKVYKPVQRHSSMKSSSFLATQKYKFNPRKQLGISLGIEKSKSVGIDTWELGPILSSSKYSVPCHRASSTPPESTYKTYL